MQSPHPKSSVVKSKFLSIDLTTLDNKNLDFPTNGLWFEKQPSCVSNEDIKPEIQKLLRWPWKRWDRRLCKLEGEGEGSVQFFRYYDTAGPESHKPKGEINLWDPSLQILDDITVKPERKLKNALSRLCTDKTTWRESAREELIAYFKRQDETKTFDVVGEMMRSTSPSVLLQDLNIEYGEMPCGGPKYLFVYCKEKLYTFKETDASFPSGRKGTIARLRDCLLRIHDAVQRTRLQDYEIHAVTTEHFREWCKENQSLLDSAESFMTHIDTTFTKIRSVFSETDIRRILTHLGIGQWSDAWFNGVLLVLDRFEASRNVFKDQIGVIIPMLTGQIRDNIKELVRQIFSKFKNTFFSQENTDDVTALLANLLDIEQQAERLRQAAPQQVTHPQHLPDSDSSHVRLDVVALEKQVADAEEQMALAQKQYDECDRQFNDLQIKKNRRTLYDDDSVGDIRSYQITKSEVRKKRDSSKQKLLSFQADINRLREALKILKEKGAHPLLTSPSAAQQTDDRRGDVEEELNGAKTATRDKLRKILDRHRETVTIKFSEDNDETYIFKLSELQLGKRYETHDTLQISQTETSTDNEWSQEWIHSSESIRCPSDSLMTNEMMLICVRYSMDIGDLEQNDEFYDVFESVFADEFDLTCEQVQVVRSVSIMVHTDIGPKKVDVKMAGQNESPTLEAFKDKSKVNIPSANEDWNVPSSSKEDLKDVILPLADEVRRKLGLPQNWDTIKFSIPSTCTEIKELSCVNGDDSSRMSSTRSSRRSSSSLSSSSRSSSKRPSSERPLLNRSSSNRSSSSSSIFSLHSSRDMLQEKSGNVVEYRVFYTTNQIDKLDRVKANWESVSTKLSQYTQHAPIENAPIEICTTYNFHRLHSILRNRQHSRPKFVLRPDGDVRGLVTSPGVQPEEVPVNTKNSGNSRLMFGFLNNKSKKSEPINDIRDYEYTTDYEYTPDIRRDRSSSNASDTFSIASDSSDVSNVLNSIINPQEANVISEIKPEAGDNVSPASDAGSLLTNDQKPTEGGDVDLRARAAVPPTKKVLNTQSVNPNTIICDYQDYMYIIDMGAAYALFQKLMQLASAEESSNSINMVVTDAQECKQILLLLKKIQLWSKTAAGADGTGATAAGADVGDIRAVTAPAEEVGSPGLKDYITALEEHTTHRGIHMCCMLACIYHRGLGGVPKNLKKAATYLAATDHLEEHRRFLKKIEYRKIYSISKDETGMKICIRLVSGEWIDIYFTRTGIWAADDIVVLNRAKKLVDNANESSRKMFVPKMSTFVSTQHVSRLETECKHKLEELKKMDKVWRKITTHIHNRSAQTIMYGCTCKCKNTGALTTNRHYTESWLEVMKNGDIRIFLIQNKPIPELIGSFPKKNKQTQYYTDDRYRNRIIIQSIDTSVKLKFSKFPYAEYFDLKTILERTCTLIRDVNQTKYFISNCRVGNPHSDKRFMGLRETFRLVRKPEARCLLLEEATDETRTKSARRDDKKTRLKSLRLVHQAEEEDVDFVPHSIYDSADNKSTTKKSWMLFFESDRTCEQWTQYIEQASKQKALMTYICSTLFGEEQNAIQFIRKLLTAEKHKGNVGNRIESLRELIVIPILGLIFITIQSMIGIKAKISVKELIDVLTGHYNEMLDSKAGVHIAFCKLDTQGHYLSQIHTLIDKAQLTAHSGEYDISPQLLGQLLYSTVIFDEKWTEGYLSKIFDLQSGWTGTGLKTTLGIDLGAIYKIIGGYGDITRSPRCFNLLEILLRVIHLKKILTVSGLLNKGYDSIEIRAKGGPTS